VAFSAKGGEKAMIAPAFLLRMRKHCVVSFIRFPVHAATSKTGKPLDAIAMLNLPGGRVVLGLYPPVGGGLG
jgi:hypothetical protein